MSPRHPIPVSQTPPVDNAVRVFMLAVVVGLATFVAVAFSPVTGFLVLDAKGVPVRTAEAPDSHAHSLLAR